MELSLSDGFDLAQDTLGQGLDSHAAAGGLGDEVLGVDLVELSEIAHVSQEAGGLKDLLKAGAGGFQDGAHVLAALLSLGGNALRNIAGGRIHGDLAGGVDEAVHDHTLGVGPMAPGALVVAITFMEITSFLKMIGLFYLIG